MVAVFINGEYGAVVNSYKHNRHIMLGSIADDFGSLPCLVENEKLKAYFVKASKSCKIIGGKKAAKASNRAYTPLEREMMVKLRGFGMTYRNIKEKFGIPISVVRNNY